MDPQAGPQAPDRICKVTVFSCLSRDLLVRNTEIQLSPQGKVVELVFMEVRKWLVPLWESREAS